MAEYVLCGSQVRRVAVGERRGATAPRLIKAVRLFQVSLVETRGSGFASIAATLTKKLSGSGFNSYQVRTVTQSAIFQRPGNSGREGHRGEPDAGIEFWARRCRTLCRMPPIKLIRPEL